MNSSRLYPLFLAASLTLAGCSVGTPASAPAAAQAGTVTAFAHLGTGRHLQSVEPWRKADIKKVDVTLWREDTSQSPAVWSKVATLNLDSEGLEDVVSFGNLRHNASYKIVLEAWQDDAKNIRIDDGEETPNSCTTYFQTTDKATVDVGVLTLKLRDTVIPD